MTKAAGLKVLEELRRSGIVLRPPSPQDIEFLNRLGFSRATHYAKSISPDATTDGEMAAAYLLSIPLAQAEAELAQARSHFDARARALMEKLSPKARYILRMTVCTGLAASALSPTERISAGNSGRALLMGGMAKIIASEPRSRSAFVIGGTN